MNVWLNMALYLFAAHGVLTLLISLFDRLAPQSARQTRRPFMSLVIAVKDKESLIEGLIRSMVNFRLLASGVGFEIVAVDDHSQDATPEILDKLSRRYPHLRVVRMTETGSFGSALEVGFFLCKSPVAVMCDARGPIDLRTMVEILFTLFGGKPRRPRPGGGYDDGLDDSDDGSDD